MPLDPPFDLYAELEVSETASSETIDAAWRSLLKRNHPDVVGSEAATARSKRLNTAHDILANPASRDRYNATSRAERERRAAESAPPPTPQRASPPPPPPAREPPRSAPREDPPERAPALKLDEWMAKPVVEYRRDWRRAAVIFVGALAVIGAFRIVVNIASLTGAVSGGAGESASPATGYMVAPTPAEVTPVSSRTPAPGIGAPTAVDARRTPTIGPTASVVASPTMTTAAATPWPTPSEAPTAPPSVAPTPVPSQGPIELKGGGSMSGTPVDLIGGTYRAEYSVSSAAGGGCTWVLVLTASDWSDTTLASTAVTDETVRDTETDPGVAAGPATLRVDSDCPDWSVTLTRIGP